MNYSVELWDSYNKVENNLLFHLRGLKNFIYMIKELNKSMKEFSKNLKKVYEMNLRITTNESLSIGIEQFLNNLFKCHKFLEKYILDINSNIIDPLNIFQENLLKKLNRNYKETIDSEKNYESYVTEIIFTRNKFHSTVKQLEKKMLELENNKINKNIDKKDIDNLEKEVKSNIELAKDSEKMYLSYIKFTNRIQEDYIETKKRNLNEIQNMEVELGEKMKHSLNTYYILHLNYLNDLKIETDKKIKLLDEIDINSDISKFIRNNRTSSIPPYRFEYMPYICTLDKHNLNIKDENLKEINIKIKQEIKKLFPEEKDISLIRTKTEKDIESLIDSIINEEKEKVINSNEENFKIVSNKNLRRIFLHYLNRLRNNIHITLSDLSYRIIGELLNECLNYSFKEMDFASIKLIMTISTNLFKINHISNNPRIFLNYHLKKCKFWKDFNFWENLIRYDIIEEMHNQKKNYLFSDESDILNNIRIKSIVKSKLSTNLYNMISFDVNHSLMNEIVNYFGNFYKLQQYAIKNLKNIINKNKNIEIKRKRMLNCSIDLSLINKITCNSSKIIYSDREYKNHKINYIIEPVKQDEQNMSNYFDENDKEIDKKSLNIFNDKDYDNIIVMESKNTNKMKNESVEKNLDKINNDDYEDESYFIDNNK